MICVFFRHFSFFSFSIRASIQFYAGDDSIPISLLFNSHDGKGKYFDFEFPHPFLPYFHLSHVKQ